MAGAVKKDVVCDYCQADKEPNLIYTAKKVFAGRKIIELLQIVAQRSLPVSIGIKLCNVCASSLMSTVAIIEKTQQLIEKNLGIRKIKTTTTSQVKDKKQNSDSPSEVIDLDVNAVNKEDKLDKKKPQKNKHVTEVPVLRASPRKAPSTSLKAPSTPLSQASPKKKTSAVDNLDEGNINLSSPNKLVPANQKLATPNNKVPPIDDIEEDLEDAVKLTPSDATVKKKNSIIQLFGASETIDVNVSESEEDGLVNGNEESSDAKKNPVAIKIKMNSFECKLCDFVSKSPKPLKEHLKSVHNQQRPRIFFCNTCPKSFGLLKTLTQHLVTHGITTQRAPAKHEAKKKKSEPKPTKAQIIVPQPKLAVLTALNAPVEIKQPVENTNPEYTFQVNGESASTPKPIDGRRKSMSFQCDVCDSEVQTVKLMQDHMKTAHQVEKPKIFKCTICDRHFSTKQSLDFHLEKHINPEVDTPKNSSKLKESETKDKQSNISSINEKLKSLEHKTDEEMVKSPKKKKLESSPKKKSEEIHKSPVKNTKSEEIHKSPVKKTKSKTEDVIDLSNTEISLLSNDEESLNVTVLKSPLKKLKSKTEKKIALDSLTDITLPLNGEESRNKIAKRKPDTSLSNDDQLNLTTKSKKPKNNSIKATIKDVDENLDEINHEVKPHKKIRLESVIYSETDNGELSCDLCGKRASSRKRLESHIQKKHGKTLTCPTCSSISNSLRDYVSHFSDCDTTNGLPCGKQKCKKIFEDHDYLISHLRKKHDWS